MFALAQASDTEKGSEAKYRKSSSKSSGRSQVPGAVPVHGGGNAPKGKTLKQRGVDDDDTDTPEVEKSKAAARGNKLGGGYYYDSTDAPRHNYRARQAATQRQPFDEGFDQSDDDSIENAPGASNVQGVGRASGGGSRNMRDATHVMAQAEMDSEYITAHLVEEGTVDPEARDQIRREAQEEMIKDTVKAEIAGPVDNRKWYICACVATLIVIAVVVIAVVMTRPDPDPVINNSFCEQAKPIEIGGSVAESTRGSDIIDANTCIFENFNNMTQGRWFTFAGNGAPVTASTCLNTNFDTRISVFSGGSCSQDEIQCIDGNEDNPSSCCAPGIVDCQQRSAITWSTQNGLQYYIYVHGANPDEMGDFELSLSEAEIASETGNTVCDRTVRVSVDSTVSGSNEGAREPQDLEPCDAVSVNGPGVWYVAQGTGGVVEVSTCDSTGTLEDTQISIYSGSCAGLECVKSNDDSCGSKSEVSWQSVEGRPYYIYVHSKSDEARGSFDVRIASIQESDLDAQCVGETQALLRDGFEQEIANAIESASDQIDPATACRDNNNGGVTCRIDGLAGPDHSIDATCRARGGRYILQSFSLECALIRLELINLPNCVSTICSDEYIVTTVATIGTATVRLYESILGLACILEDAYFTDG